MLTELYRSSLSLLTDLYQLTMAYGYWKLGRAEQEAVFHLFFRKPPFGGGYAIAAGLGPAAEYLTAFGFDPSDIEFLKTLRGNDGAPLFEHDFLDYLADLRLSIDIDAIPEGTLAFGQQPLLRVRGPLLQCQLLETPLLNIINFQTLIATKASRICLAASGQPVLEFGLRRAQGIDGGLSASRAAYIGGCAATSNVLAGKIYGIPVKGTHAHSWVMSFDDETESFEEYADVLPNNCVFLVDTYDTLQGVHKAVEVGKSLRERGHEMVGIRLDSGDLAALSIQARRILDDGGFPDASIVASNDLDEKAIESLRRQNAKIAVWGVGTKLVTAFDQPALGGVYKLGALKSEDGNWIPKLKISEQPIKTSLPGMLQVRRYLHEGHPVGDQIFDESTGVDEETRMVDLSDTRQQHSIPTWTDSIDLLVPALRDGNAAYESETLDQIRTRAQENLNAFRTSQSESTPVEDYPVGINVGLHELRERLIRDANS